MKKAILFAVLLLPNIVQADLWNWYFDISSNFGGDTLVRYSNRHCGFLEIFFGCRETHSKVDAGDGADLTLGGILKLPDSPIAFRLAYAYGFNSESDKNSRLSFDHPHTDLAVEYRAERHRVALGLSLYEDTTLDFREWSPATRFSGNLIKFKKSIGGFIEYKFHLKRFANIGIRWSIVDYQVESIDNNFITNGETINANHIGLFFSYER